MVEAGSARARSSPGRAVMNYKPVNTWPRAASQMLEACPATPWTSTSVRLRNKALSVMGRQKVSFEPTARGPEDRAATAQPTPGAARKARTMLMKCSLLGCYLPVESALSLSAFSQEHEEEARQTACGVFAICAAVGWPQKVVCLCAPDYVQGSTRLSTTQHMWNVLSRALSSSEVRGSCG